jgi:nitrogenase iron protein NifH
MKKIAFYGKHGIGKSMVAANISAALAEKGHSVFHIGCGPKNDSTKMLLGEICSETLMDQCKRVKNTRSLHLGFAGVQCVEAGSRGIDLAMERLKALKAIESQDFAIYDVLGDTVFSGSGLLFREGYVTDVYIVSSGELMSLYAANNIAIGISMFSEYCPVRLAGIIGNKSTAHNEMKLLIEFAERLNSQLVAFIPHDYIMIKAESLCKTVIEFSPHGKQAETYRNLAVHIEGKIDRAVPTPLTFAQVEDLWGKYTAQINAPGCSYRHKNGPIKHLRRIF